MKVVTSGCERCVPGASSRTLFGQLPQPFSDSVNTADSPIVQTATQPSLTALPISVWAELLLQSGSVGRDRKGTKLLSRPAVTARRPRFPPAAAKHELTFSRSTPPSQSTRVASGLSMLGSQWGHCFSHRRDTGSGSGGVCGECEKHPRKNDQTREEERGNENRGGGEAVETKCAIFPKAISLISTRELCCPCYERSWEPGSGVPRVQGKLQ